MTKTRPATLVSIILGIAGCGSTALPPGVGYGPTPTLPEPQERLLPTVHIAPAQGWPADAMPAPAEGLVVGAFARNLDHPRWLYVLPNGDVLVAETNAPPRPEDAKGFRAQVMGRVMKRAGAAVPSADRITLLRDADGDGVAEFRTVLVDGLHSPFGMALADGQLYVANTDALVRFPYTDGDLRLPGPGALVTPLPAGPRNHHWTKNVLAGRPGTAADGKLYVTVGSNSNVAEHGLDVEADRASILEVDPDRRSYRVYASGLRNPNGLAWEPESGQLWAVVNERDELGPDLVPDYLTSVQSGGFYGWPWSYYGDHVDTRVEPARPDRVVTALRPDYALGSHTASLGLAFYAGSLFPARYRGGAFIGQHGSWNRKPANGYAVVFVPFTHGQPGGEPEPVLGGFLSPSGDAYGRPVGVAIDRQGALLVADDVGNTVWRVEPGTARWGAAPGGVRREP
ncbi:MAG: sorbosone dehydrogenase family protein [Gammaproteobacteria bacterium]